MTNHILKSAAIIFTTILFFASCSKEKKIRHDLAGTWKVIATTDDSISTAMALGAGFQYQFSDCKKKNEPCNGVYTLTYNLLGFPISIGVNFTWRVKEDVLTITPADTATLDAASLRIDFTSKDEVTATDIKTNNTYSLNQL